jgi:cytochrome c556
MKRTLVAATLGIAAMVAFDAAAQVKPEILIKQRQAAMTLQGKYFGPLAAMAQGKAPYNATVVQRNAGFLGNLSRMPWDGFDPSTKDVKDVKTAALPAVFSEPAKFKEAAERLESETSKLYEMSRSGDEASVKAQIGAVGKACGGCHETFRQKQ